VRPCHQGAARPQIAMEEKASR